jgi:Spy/CpxP family protein refolding chaperone
MTPTVLAGRWPLLLVMLVALAAAAISASQNTNPPKWWNSEQYRRELGLTQEQSRKLEEIFQQAAPTQRSLKKALDDAETQFEKIVDQADEKTVIDEINRVVAARAELMRSHSLMLYRMRRVLTRDQWTRLGVLTQREQQKPSEKPK